MIAITRTLSSADLGVYYASAAYPQLLSRIFDLGMPHAARFYLLKFPNQVRYICKLVAITAIGISPFIGCIFLFLHRLPIEVNEISFQISENWIVLSIYCLLLILNSIFNAFIISLERYKMLLITSTLPYLFFIGIIFYKANSGSITVTDILVQLAASELIILLLCMIPVIRAIKQTKKVARPFNWKDVMKYALKIYPNGLMKTMSTRFDRVVLSFIATPVFIGQYSVLMTLRDIGTIPVTTYGQTFMNELSKAIRLTQEGLKEKGSIKKMIDKNLLYILALYSGGFIAFLFLQEYLLALFFHDLSDDKIYLMSAVLMISAIPNVLVGFIHYFFLTMNKPLHISISSGLALASFCGFVAVTYKNLGSDSFFYAAVVSAVVGFIYLFIYYRAILKTLPGRNL